MDIKNLASIQEQLGMSPGTSNLKLYKLFLSEIINKHTAYHTTVKIYRHRDADTTNNYQSRLINKWLKPYQFFQKHLSQEIFKSLKN